VLGDRVDESAAPRILTGTVKALSGLTNTRARTAYGRASSFITS
jgi:hypothetical protein